MDSVKPACFIPWVIPNEVDTYLASQENNCVTMFAVVHFVEDNTVEVVPMLWLVKSGNKDYCYWPPRNQTEKAKKACIPDKEKWDIHPVRILCNAETYSRGKTLSRRAEVTSHLESEEEEEGRRNRKRNRKYASSGDDRGKKRHYQDSENDDEETDDEHIQSCRQQVAPKPAELPSPPPALPPILLPLPPTLPPLPPTLPPPPPTLPPHPPTLPPHPPTFQLSIRPSSPVPTYEEFEVMEVNQDTGMPHIIRKSRSNTPVLPTRRMSFEQKVDQMIEGVIAASPEPASHCQTERSHSMSNLQVLETPSSSRSQRVMTSPEPTARSVSQIETPSNSGQGAVLTSMLRRIMGIEKTLQEHSSMLTRVLDVLDVQEDAGPLLEEAVATVEELMELDEKLQNKDFAKKMVNYLSSLGGGDPGDTTRRMMRKVANNFVWSHFSVHGQKGKKKLSNLRIFEVIKGAYRRKYKGAGSDKEAEANIGHTLKHAPHRPGGVKIRPQQNVTAVNDDNEEPRT